MPYLPLNPFNVAQDPGEAHAGATARGQAVVATDSQHVCGIVLAGSHHWGEGVFERVLRGPLLPVALTPLIEYPLHWLRDAGVRHAVLCANSATRMLRDVLGEGNPDSIALQYFEDMEPRGPAGCARDAAAMTHAARFVVIEGTIVPTLDFSAVLDAHARSGAAATVVVEFDRRRRGMASAIRRQPAGIYVFERSALMQVAETGYQDIKEGLLGRLSGAGAHVAMHELHGLSAKVLDYSSYASVSRWLVSRAIERPAFLPEYLRVGEGLHHPSAFVHPTARLIGPVLLAAESRVEEHAVVVGPASIGERTHVAEGALVSRSFVWDDCHIGAGAIVDASVIADRCQVPPGERLKNVTQMPDDFAPQPRHGSQSAAPGRRPDLATAASRARTGFAGQVAVPHDSRASAP